MILIKNKTSSFIQDIEDLCKSNNIDYIDAVIHWCEINNLEIEYAAELIKTNSLMKSKIQIEAENLNFIKKTAKLPF